MSDCIEMINCSFSYGDNPIFANMSLKIPTKKITYLQGASGIGKTTLLKLVSGKLQVTSGKIIRPVQHFSFCYQDITLIPYLSASQNIQYVMSRYYKPDVQIAKTTELLKRLDLLEYASYLPNQLSGGMQRRIAFLRALAVPADFLILDEIFDSLDENTAKEVATILFEEVRKRKIGALCATHTIVLENELTECLCI